jgi:hypothetical protein
MSVEAEIRAHCSWCFHKTRHKHVGKNKVGRAVFECGKCSQRTLVCMAPGCYELARGEGMVDDVFCAAHAGEIAGFNNLTMKLEDIDEYPKLFEREVSNLGKATKIGAIATGTGLVVAPLAFLGAPFVGGAIGVQFFGLSGAAATSKGLATLGLGALSAGGLGMAGGTAVVTGVGAALGGAASGAVANAYWGDVQGFKITRLKEGRGPSVLVINGWLTEKAKNLEREWLNGLGKFYGANPWYLVEWENKRLRDLGKLSVDSGGQAAALAALAKMAAQASSKATGPMEIAQAALLAVRLAKNPWHVAFFKSAQTGVLLADAISRTPTRKKYVLMGHSLGAKVVVHCLQALGDQGKPRIKSAHLLGGAIGTGKSETWKAAAAAVSDTINNYYSKNDDVLRVLYNAARTFVGTPPIGRNRIRWQPDKISNIDVTEWVGSHNEYKQQAVHFLEK